VLLSFQESSQSFDPELELATDVEGLDVIVRSQYHASDPYPIVITSSFASQALIVSTADFGGSVGQLFVAFDDDGNVVGWNGTRVLLNNATARVDPTVWSAVLQQQAKINQLNSVVVGYTSASLYGLKGGIASVGSSGATQFTNGCRYGECQMGRVITDAMLDFCPDCDFAFMNGG
jgi:2',3'-cyclic-nucleotide 2'-phosphodiesterase (5'-nucleotidase family)